MATGVFINCFICEQPGEYYVGGKLRCLRHPEGPVVWIKVGQQERPPAREVMWRTGSTVECIDFSLPGAPSCP